MTLQTSRVHPKPPSDVYSQTSLPELLPNDCTHALHELGGLDGPSEKDGRSSGTLMHRAVTSAHKKRQGNACSRTAIFLLDRLGRLLTLGSKRYLTLADSITPKPTIFTHPSISGRPWVSPYEDDS